MQIFKNCGAQKVIVSSVQIELHGSVSRKTYLVESGLMIITFGNFISSSNLRDGVCMLTWWEINVYSSVCNIIYQFWISGVFVLEDPTSLSGQLFWVSFTKSFLPLVKKLPIFEYKWVNVKLYSSISCEYRIVRNLSDFFRNVWTPLKFKEDLKFILFQDF
jgi:hypothetical protein